MIVYKKNASLEVIKLRGGADNKDSGIVPLSKFLELLKNNNILQELEITIGDKSDHAIGDLGHFLQSKPSVNKVTLQKQYWSKSDIIHLCNILNTNSSIKSFAMAGHVAPDSDFKLLEKSLIENKHINELNIQYLNFTFNSEGNQLKDLLVNEIVENNEVVKLLKVDYDVSYTRDVDTSKMFGAVDATKDVQYTTIQAKSAPETKKESEQETEQCKGGAGALSEEELLLMQSLKLTGNLENMTISGDIHGAAEEEL